MALTPTSGHSAPRLAPILSWVNGAKLYYPPGQGPVLVRLYGPVSSLLYIAVLAMCGTRLLRSSILAAALLSVVPGYLTSFDTSRQMFAFGVIAVAATIVIAKREVITEMMTTFNRSSRKARPLAPSPGVAAPRAAAGTRVPAGMVR